MFKKFKFNPIWCANDSTDSLLENFVDVNLNGKASDDAPAPGGGSENDPSENDPTESDPFEGDPRFETPANDEANQDDDPAGDSKDSEDDPDSDDPDDSNAPDITSRLEGLEAQNKMLMELLIKNKKEETPEPDPESSDLTDPFEGEAYTNLAKGMDWDETEQQLMKTFLKDAFQFNKATTVKEAQTAIPEIVNSQMTVAQKKEAIKTAFYGNNPNLKGKEKYVSMLSTDVVREFKAANKPLDMNTILTETSKRAYELFNINKETKDGSKPNSEPARGKNPGFATPTGARKKAPKISRDAAMIQNILNLDK